MSRPPPPKLTPIVVGNIQYGENSGYNSHLLPVIDMRTGQKIRDIDLYHYAIDPDLEADVQEVYVRAMSRSRDGKGIVIENERGHRFLLNPQDQTTRELNHPCSLRLVEAVKAGDRWSVRVELSTSNERPTEDFYLDRLSFGDTDELGKHHAFPPEGGTFRIRPRHHNHFSPNDVELESNPITVELVSGQNASRPIKPPTP